MIVLGIDVGLTGAVAVLKDGRFLSVQDLPVMQKVSKSAKVKMQLDSRNLVLALGKISADVAYVERVSTRPGQGIASNASLMHSLGVVECALAANGIPMVFVESRVWKKHFGLPKEKDVTRAWAIRTIPEAAEFLQRKKDSGRADALAIACYGAFWQQAHVRRGVEALL